MSLWEEFELSESRAKKLRIGELNEPTEKDCLFLMCFMTFGGICSEEEVRKIADIAYGAYERKRHKEEKTR